MPFYNSSRYFSYVREAHQIADQLKQKSPQYHSQISELQGIVSRAYRTLEETDELERHITTLQPRDVRKPVLFHTLCNDRACALTNLRAAHQTLQTLDNMA